MTRAELLAEYLNLSDCEPVIGKSDCYPYVIEWIRRACGKSVPLKPYSTREEGYAHAQAAGGLLAYASSLMSAAGLSETTAYKLGDVGLIQLRHGEMPGIFLAFGIAIRSEGKGCRIIIRGHVLKAWSVP